MCVGSGSTRFSTDGFRLLAFCILILWHVLTPHIQGGSRMRRSARTVLCGGYRAIDIPTATAKYLPLRVHPHFRLTARGHVSAEMANIGGIGLSLRERRWQQKERMWLPRVRRRPVSHILRVGLPFWLTANSTCVPR